MTSACIVIGIAARAHLIRIVRFSGLSFIASRRMDGAVAFAMMVSTLSVLVSSHQVCFIGSEYDPLSGSQPRWFLPYKDPCKCTAIRLGGMNVPASSYRQGAPYYLDELILREDPEEIQALFNCKVECLSPEPLGLEDGTIPDDRISASSSYSGHHPTSKARLNYDGNWAASSWSFTDSWLEVDLVESTVVSGVITQGGTGWRVTRYNVAYKKQSSSDYVHVVDADGDIAVFRGNIDDPTTPVTSYFHQSIVATVVRIEPVAWKFGVALRLELLGCRLD